jgi:hypothetical protein
MKTLFSLILPLLLASRLAAFEWPGGTMQVSVVFRGDEVFAGWVPSSPWGSTPFLRDPVVELRNAQNDVVAEYTITGGAIDWYSGGTRSGVASFNAAPGTYAVTTRPGQRLIRISGEGYSGFRLSEESISLPAPPNRAPTVSWRSAPSIIGHGQTYTITAAAYDDDGNLAEVNVWKNGQPFAFADGGNGTDGESGNPTSDAGAQTVTFTAQAVDASGATSPLISHVVTITAPVNNPPTVTLLAPTGQTVTAGATLTLSARATDPDGNLSGHNLDIQRPAGDWNFQGGFATGEPYQGGPIGNGGDSTRSASFTFTEVGTYYVRSGAFDGSGWYHSATVAITVASANRTPTIAWTSKPGNAASGVAYTVAARGHDDDGNLARVNVWKNGQPFAFAGGGNGTDGDSGNPTSDTGPQTITFTAQAFDGDGAASSVITHLVTIAAPPLAQYTLATSASAGGSVSAGGTFVAGSTAYVTATPDATHDFAGWSGDAGGTANPLGVLMDRSKTVQANFALKSFALTTSATTGGSVTPGGSYPYGTLLTLSGTPDGTHRFLGWAGDATGTAPSLTVLVDRALWVQAVFTDKTAQTITFAPLTAQPVGGPPIALVATTSSGLPVNFSVVSGPAVLSGNQLTVTGPGAITVQAGQPGDGEYLPAPSVARTFNAVAAAILKYRPAARTLLHGSTTGGTAPFVLERP